jgi:hypothetical protein
MKNADKVIRRDASNANQPVKYHVLGLDDWDFFDSLVSFFEKYYEASVENKEDGIHTRTWQLRAKDEYFMLEHNEDLGNWFYSCEEEGDSALMRAMAEDLECRLKDVPYD